jgi:hypothetical protein
VADSEDAGQISMQKLETITSKYGLQMSTCKAKTMAFRGSKIVNFTLEQATKAQRWSRVIAILFL